MFFIRTIPSVTCTVKQNNDGKFQITLPKGTKIKEKDFDKSELTDAEQLVKDIREKYKDYFNGTTYITTKDIVFDAPAQPVKFALGSNQNGRDYLINKETGLSFAEYYLKQ